MGRETRIGRFVVEFVTHVGEQGALWLKPLDDGDGFFDVRVARVRVVAQSVDYENVEVLEKREADFGHVAHVGEVGGAAEAIASDLLIAMDDGDSLETGAEELGSGAWGGIEAVNMYAGAGGVAIFLAKGVLEDAFDVAGCFVVGIDGHVAIVAEGERA